MIWLSFLSLELGCARPVCQEACLQVRAAAIHCGPGRLELAGFKRPADVAAMCRTFVFEQRTLGADPRQACHELTAASRQGCAGVLAFDWDGALAR